MISEEVLMDNMEYMAQFPDGFFHLAVVDPPYDNANITGGYTSGKGGGVARQKNYVKTLWECKKPSDAYYHELVRVSKNQIIWGANHLCDFLPKISSGWIFWDKMNGDVSFSDGELAWTSFNKGLRKFQYRWSGMLQQDMKNKENRIHPTQKPVALYDWTYANYLPQGGKVLDTHLGSGSNRIAADKAGNIDFYSCENDPDHYADQEKRWKNHKAQLVLAF